MNKDNMQKVIDAIKFDGAKKFNMSVFVGKLEYEDDEISVFENDELAHKFPVHRVRVIHEGTDLFNCTSMGCIAGFATAVANQWKTPEWLDPKFQENNPDRSTYDMVRDFEKTSNSFLDLTSGQGKKLYYADHDSLWKYLRYYESNRYPELKYEGEENGEADEIVEQYCDWDDDNYEIDFLTIDYKTAADVLTRIMNEEIFLGENYGDIEIRNLQH